MRLITKGPLIRADLYSLLGGLFWFIHFSFRRQDLSGWGGLVFFASGLLSIVAISAGTYIQYSYRYNPEDAVEM